MTKFNKWEVLSKVILFVLLLTGGGSLTHATKDNLSVFVIGILVGYALIQGMVFIAFVKVKDFSSKVNLAFTLMGAAAFAVIGVVLICNGLHLKKYSAALASDRLKYYYWKTGKDKHKPLMVPEKSSYYIFASGICFLSTIVQLTECYLISRVINN